MERSLYVNHCLSLNSQLNPDRLYNRLKERAKDYYINNNGGSATDQDGVGVVLTHAENDAKAAEYQQYLDSQKDLDDESSW